MMMMMMMMVMVMVSGEEGVEGISLGNIFP
jgi:hypothetical protein